jgi:hypothetical protein
LDGTTDLPVQRPAKRRADPGWCAQGSSLRRMSVHQRGVCEVLSAAAGND